MDLLLQSINVPIDRNTGETLELLRDMMTRWKTTAELTRLRSVRGGPTGLDFGNSCVPPKFFAVEVSFDELLDAAERTRLKSLPTSFSLKAEEVDALRSAAAAILRSSQPFQAFIEDVKGTP